MSKVEAYTQGWMTGDLKTIQDACAEDFVYDDPVDGRFTKAQFPEYWESLEGDGAWNDTVVQEVDGVETGWTWWRWTIEGQAERRGSCLMKADADGLHLARLAYYE